MHETHIDRDFVFVVGWLAEKASSKYPPSITYNEKTECYEVWSQLKLLRTVIKDTKIHEAFMKALGIVPKLYIRKYFWKRQCHLVNVPFTFRLKFF